MKEIRRLIRGIISEIVSTEVERMQGGASEVQKSQSGYGYLGNQSDAPKQTSKNDSHIFFNTVTTSSGEGEGESGGEQESAEDIQEVKQYPIEDPPLYGDTDYKQRNGIIIYMTPERYLSLVKKLDLDEESLENIDDLSKMMIKGKKVDPPTLYLSDNQIIDHDGRHRAYAAKEIGITELPVLIIDVEDKIPNIKELKKQIS
jgi:hypothetical protein